MNILYSLISFAMFEYPEKQYFRNPAVENIVFTFTFKIYSTGRAIFMNGYNFLIYREKQGRAVV